MKKKNQHGGRRAGAGRPPLDNSTRGRAVNVYLTGDELTHVTDLGSGSPQAGIKSLVSKSRQRTSAS